MGKKKLAFVLFGIAIILITIGLCLSLGVFGGEKKEEKKETENKDKGVVIDTTRLTDVSVEEFDGVYKSGNDVVKIVKVADDEMFGPSVFVYYSLGKNAGNDFYQFENDYLTTDSSVIDQKVIVLYKEGIGLIERKPYDKDGNYVELDFEKEKATPFKKESGYTKEDMFKDFYGDLTQLDSKYTGLYQSTSGVVYTFLDKNGVVQIVYSINNTFGTNYGKPNDEGEVVAKYRSEKITFAFEDNSLIITDESSDEKFENLSGTFVKERQLTINDVINNIVIDF